MQTIFLSLFYYSPEFVDNVTLFLKKCDFTAKTAQKDVSNSIYVLFFFVQFITNHLKKCNEFAHFWTI